jgi:hypothetical protein
MDEGGAAMSETWITKFGPRRVRFDPPTLKEAIVAAQGLTDDLDQQAEIAAALMALPIEDARAELAKMAPPRNSAQIVTSSGRNGGARTVIVERKPSRQFTGGAGAPALRSAVTKRLGAGAASFGARQGSRDFLRHGFFERKPFPS